MKYGYMKLFWLRPFRNVAGCIAIFLYMSTTLSAQTSVYFEDFESGSLPTGWTANPGTVNGLADVINSTTSCGGSYHLRLGKVDPQGGLNTAYARLDVNLGAFKDSQLLFTFCVLDFYDEYQVEDGVFISVDGGG